jgi:hypothetical protein
MKRLLGVAAAAVAGVVLVGAPARAQMVYPYSRPNYGPGYTPQLSPYLNFLRGGDPSANYFLGTLPEFQRRSNAKQFSSAINALNQDLLYQSTAEPPDPLLFRPLMETGHPTAFNNTLTYFNQSTPLPGARPPSSRGYTRPGTTGYGVPSVPGATPQVPRR